MSDEKYTGYTSKLVPNAKILRPEMTRQEKHLWYDFLRTYHVKFYRQGVKGTGSLTLLVCRF